MYHNLSIVVPQDKKKGGGGDWDDDDALDPSLLIKTSGGDGGDDDDGGGGGGGGKKSSKKVTIPAPLSNLWQGGWVMLSCALIWPWSHFVGEEEAAAASGLRGRICR